MAFPEERFVTALGIFAILFPQLQFLLAYFLYLSMISARLGEAFGALPLLLIVLQPTIFKLALVPAVLAGLIAALYSANVGPANWKGFLTVSIAAACLSSAWTVVMVGWVGVVVHLPRVTVEQKVGLAAISALLAALLCSWVWSKVERRLNRGPSAFR